MRNLGWRGDQVEMGLPNPRKTRQTMTPQSLPHLESQQDELPARKRGEDGDMSSHDRLCQPKVSTSPEEAQAFLKGMKAKKWEDGNRQGKEGEGGS